MTPKEEYTHPGSDVMAPPKLSGHGFHAASTAANTPEMSSASTRTTPAGGMQQVHNFAPQMHHQRQHAMQMAAGLAKGTDLNMLARAGMISGDFGMAGRGVASAGQSVANSNALNPNVTERKLFIGGLPSLVDRQSLWAHFSRFGQLEEAVVMMDKLTGRSRGFGFITFVSPNDLEACIAYAHGHVLLDKAVDVKRAVSQEELRTSIPSLDAAAVPMMGGLPQHMGMGTMGPAGSLGPAGQDNPCKVFAGGLPASCDRERLRLHFSRYGVVTDCVVKVDRTSGRSRGFGYVTFQTPLESQAAIQGGPDGQGNTIDGKWVEVKPSTRDGTGPSKFVHGGGLRGNGGFGMAGRGAAVNWGMPPPQHFMAPQSFPGYGTQSPLNHHHQQNSGGYASTGPSATTTPPPSVNYSNSPVMSQQQGGQIGYPAAVMSPAHGYPMMQQRGGYQPQAPQVYATNHGMFAGMDSLKNGDPSVVDKEHQQMLQAMHANRAALQ